MILSLDGFSVVSLNGIDVAFPIVFLFIVLVVFVVFFKICVAWFYVLLNYSWFRKPVYNAGFLTKS